MDQSGVKSSFFIFVEEIVENKKEISLFNDKKKARLLQLLLLSFSPLVTWHDFHSRQVFTDIYGKWWSALCGHGFVFVVVVVTHESSVWVGVGTKRNPAQQQSTPTARHCSPYSVVFLVLSGVTLLLVCVVVEQFLNKINVC